ncbi:MAG: urea ABC transporter substrate-binding protein [Pleurocapsa minor GSE-CHR-MK-17-07R]|nr:urea ABC transporter substrate-binding protein [Pleurocapsa minor GSE-CHR-MK 17-07R]
MRLRTLLIVIVFVGIGLAGILIGRALAAQNTSPIRVGILHALSGTMAISERSVVDATMMAIEEINAAGGVLGRQIEPILVDSQSDWDYSAQQAERLISTEGVDVVFGCWTSACRRTVRPVFESLNHLLVYPIQYEGLESSPNILYTGAAPNQQIIPAVKWSLDNLGTRFYLVGSDYVFPRSANAIIRDQVTSLRGTIVGESYILLGSTDVDAVVADIVATEPDVILNTINGDSNIAFFRALRDAGVTSDELPTLSFSISESELPTLDTARLVGDYAAWNYFQSVDSAENARFVAQFQARYGADRVTSDPIEAAYFGVYLWAQAVRTAGTPEVSEVQRALGDQSFNAPGGIVSIDPESNHTWRTVRIGQIRSDGQFDIVWDSGNPIRPVPYPIYRTQESWDGFLNDLYLSWGGSWANPGLPAN